MKCFFIYIIAGLLHNRECGEQINHINFVDYIHRKFFLFEEVKTRHVRGIK